MQKKKEKQTGITLIALVVTIVVLIILAAVSINVLIGENGVIQKATESSIKQDNASVKEALRLKVLEYSSNKITQGNYTDIIQLLQEGGYLSQEYILNIPLLMGQKLNTGNGTEYTDIYGIEDGYHLIYIDKNGDWTDLGEIENLQEVIVENDELLKYLVFDKETGEITGLKNCEEYYWGEGSRTRFPIENVVIPKEIDGIPVKKINIYRCFYRCDTIKSLTVQNGTEAYGDIDDCPNLEIIRLYGKSDNVENFRRVKKLKEVTMTDDINRTSINGIVCSRDQTKLIFYPPYNGNKIPSTITIISSYSFSQCTNFTKIVLPEGITIIEDNAFSNLDNLEEVVLPNTVLNMGRYAFSYCKKLTKVTLSNQLENIGEYAFYLCEELETIVVPSSVRQIEGNAFSYCTKLQDITLEEGLQSIGPSAFIECKMKNIDIPSSVTNIGSSAFYMCTSLRTINIKKPKDSIQGAPWSNLSGITVNWKTT